MLERMRSDEAFRVRVRERADNEDRAYYVLAGKMNIDLMDPLCDRDEGQNWLTKGAEAGDPWAMVELASIFFSGENASAEQKETGRKWLQKACLKKYPEALFLFGKHLHCEQGRNTTEGIKFIAQAAEQGHVEAKYCQAVAI